MSNRIFGLLAVCLLHLCGWSQDPHVTTGHAASAGAVAAASDTTYLLRPDRLFDGEQMHEGWAVIVRGHIIWAVGPAASLTMPEGAVVLDLKGVTLMPGLIEGHSHLFLHPYNEVSWNDQVLKESRAERVARAVVHARATLMAGFTTTRDLGTEELCMMM